MAITFCQIADSRLENVSDEAKLNSLLSKRLNKLETSLSNLPGVRFAHLPSRLLTWPDESFQYRSDWVMLKSRLVTWDQVYESINQIHAVHFATIMEKEGEILFHKYSHKNALSQV